jgi:hypothetical protein
MSDEVRKLILGAVLHMPFGGFACGCGGCRPLVTGDPPPQTRDSDPPWNGKFS